MPVQLEIRLFAGLKCNNPELPYFGKIAFNLDVPDGTTVGELRALLAIDPTIRLLTMVNHHHEGDDWVLEESDRIGIFPPIGGG